MKRPLPLLKRKLKKKMKEKTWKLLERKEKKKLLERKI